MRLKIPWSEAATLAALYSAIAVWSCTRHVVPVGVALLALALATALCPRALADGSGVQPWPVHAAVAASGFGAVALGTMVASVQPPTVGLVTVRALCVGLSAGCAMLAAWGLGTVTRPSLFAIAVALAVTVMTSAGLSARNDVPTWARLSPVVALSVIAAVLTMRRAWIPSPQERERFVLPAMGTWLGAVLVALATWLARAGRPAAPLVAATGILASSLGLCMGSTGRWLNEATTVARWIGATAGACGVGCIVGGATGTPWIASVSSASAAVVLLPILRLPTLRADGGRLLSACDRACWLLEQAESLEDIAAALLDPLRSAARDLQANAALWVPGSEKQYGLDIAGAPRASKLVPETERALLTWLRTRTDEVLFVDVLRPLQVRRAEVRPVVASLEEHGAFAVVPLGDQGDLVGVLLVPRGRRRSLPTYEEAQALSVLGRRVTVALRSALALEAASERVREAHARVRTTEEARLRAEQERDAAWARTRGAGAVRLVGSLERAWVGYGEAMRTLKSALASAATRQGPLVLLAEPGVCVAAVLLAFHERSARAGGPCVVLDASTVHPRDALAALVGDARVVGEVGEGEGDTDRDVGGPLAAPGLLALAGEGTAVVQDLPGLGPEAHSALLEVLKTRRSRPVGGEDWYPVRARIVIILRTSPLQSGLPVDLCEQLGETVLTVPPLRARPEDLETLVLFGIDRACRVLGRSTVGIGREALAALRAYPWPGNERELFEVLEQAVQSAQGLQIALQDLSFSSAAGSL